MIELIVITVIMETNNGFTTKIIIFCRILLIVVFQYFV